jgi:hypothetical protein
MLDMTKIETQQAYVNFFSKLDAEKVYKVYSGRPGCGCGCKGEYRDRPKQITNVIRKATLLLTGDNINEVANVAADKYNDEWLFAVETEKRCYWIYQSM